MSVYGCSQAQLLDGYWRMAGNSNEFVIVDDTSRNFAFVSRGYDHSGNGD